MPTWQRLAAAGRATAHLAEACALAGGPDNLLWLQLAVAHGCSLRIIDHPELAGTCAGAGRRQVAPDHAGLS